MYSKPFFRYKITFTIEGQLACSTSEELFKAKIEAANKWWKKFKVDEGSMEDTFADVDSSCSLLIEHLKLRLRLLLLRLPAVLNLFPCLAKRLVLTI